jgi:hypothetical protein
MCGAGSTDKGASIARMLLLLVNPTFGRVLNINSKPAWWGDSARRRRVFFRSLTASARFRTGG